MSPYIGITAMLIGQLCESIALHAAGLEHDDSTGGTGETSSPMRRRVSRKSTPSPVPGIPAKKPTTSPPPSLAAMTKIEKALPKASKGVEAAATSRRSISFNILCWGMV